jgi:hypothetical protein
MIDDVLVSVDFDLDVSISLSGHGSWFRELLIVLFIW